MKDLVTRGTGNSRWLKSSIPAGTTWEEALALLRAGNFPIDLKGLNSAGVSTAGSAYNKANVLPDSLCTSLGITSATAEPKDAWNAVLQKITTLNTSLTNFINNDFPQPSKQGVSRPNILENWYFFGGGSYQAGRFPINQKANTSQTAIGWFIDRWRKSNANGTTSLVTGGLVLTGTGSATCTINQPIEYSQKLLGKQVTASFLNSAGSIASVTCTLPTSLPSSATTYATSSAIGGVTLWVRGNSSYFYVELGCSATSSNAIVAVKLELGPNQTLARQSGSTYVLTEIPDFATELLKCQRHMVVFKKTNTTTSSMSSSTDGIGIGTFMRYGYFYGFIPLPVMMRATPSISGTICAHYTRVLSIDDTWFSFDSGDIPQKYLHANGLSFYSSDTFSGTTYSDYYNSASILAPYGSGFILDANL